MANRTSVGTDDGRLSRSVRGAIFSCALHLPLQDELGFLRIRTRRYEIMITPNDKYLLVVLQVS